MTTPHVEARTVALHVDQLANMIGEELGVSDWVTVDQERIDRFADATGDHQWIHVDVERANRESPFGGPVAHGYLTLSMTSDLVVNLIKFSGFRLAINYGLDKVRFPSPVRVGARTRVGVSPG